MSAFIPEEVLDDIRSRCDIVEVINSYIPLKRAGGNFKALCPFHNERTPSFIVSLSKQIYHCFGCSAGGDVFGFVMQYERMDFVDAVKLLADRAGVVIPEKKIPREETNLKGLWEVNRFASELFHKWLYSPVGKPAYSYIKGRKIKDEVIKKFLIGYAPSGNEFLKEANKKGFTKDILIRAGLAVNSGNGPADMFRNRLMFPIFNPVGKVIGFSGRVLDDGLPKYLNTPETPLFHKGRVLYGLHVSKPEIIKEGRVVICEGYFDFLRSYQEGLQNIVASQGTAFTIDHVHLLRRYASSIVVSFDGDTAGDAAAMRGLEMFLEEGLQVKVLLLPKGYDPDSFISERGIAEFRKLISGARDILDTKLDRLCEGYPIVTTDGKLKVIMAILPDINKIQNEIYKRQFIKQVAARIGIPEEGIWIELKRVKKPGTAEGTIEKVLLKSAESPGERQLIQVLMDTDTLPELDPSVITQMRNAGYRTILELIIKLKKTDRWKGPASLMAYIKDEGAARLVSQLAASEIPQGLDKSKIIGDCIYDIKRRFKEEKIRQLIAKIVEAEKNKQDVAGLVLEVNNLRKG